MRVYVLIIGAWLCLLAGCGGGGGNGSPGGGGSPVAVSIAPTTASIAPAATQTFTATVTNTTNTAVTWSVQEGATGGAITSAGLYTAPATAGTYHIVATSVADPSKTAVVPVAVHIIVTISPTSTNLSLGQSATFTATVTGSTNTAVTWSVQEEPVGGTITSAGVYTPVALSGTFHVIARSQADPNQQAIATIVVQAGSATGTIQ